MPVEPYATIFKTAIEKYANFELGTLEDVRVFILSKYSESGVVQKLSIHGVQSVFDGIALHRLYGICALGR